MPNKYFQTTLFQFKDIFNRKIGFLDDAGFVFATSNIPDIENNVDDIISLCQSQAQSIKYAGFTFLPVGLRYKFDFICFVEGEDAEAQKYCEILSVSLSSIKQFYDEKFDKTNFMKNVILDNVLPGDVFPRARELHLPLDIPRVVFLVKRKSGSDLDAFDIVLRMFPNTSKDFVISLDADNMVLIKEVSEDASEKEIEKIAKTIADTLVSEAMISVSIGIGTIANNIRDLAKSFKEAQIAIEVGKVFDTEKNIINYDNLGIGRLIYQLPTTLCELFLSEVFKKESIDSLDQETIFTIQKFFENNLNVSETSRQLYVHRNTLVYRLDKVQKLTGLDLRIFDHAIVFKVAMMVKKYLVSNPIKI